MRLPRSRVQLQRRVNALETFGESLKLSSFTSAAELVYSGVSEEVDTSNSASALLTNNFDRSSPPIEEHVDDMGKFSLIPFTRIISEVHLCRLLNQILWQHINP